MLEWWLRDVWEIVGLNAQPPMAFKSDVSSCCRFAHDSRLEGDCPHVRRPEPLLGAQLELELELEPLYMLRLLNASDQERMRKQKSVLLAIYSWSTMDRAVQNGHAIIDACRPNEQSPLCPPPASTPTRTEVQT